MRIRGVKFRLMDWRLNILEPRLSGGRAGPVWRPEWDRGDQRAQVLQSSRILEEPALRTQSGRGLSWPRPHGPPNGRGLPGSYITNLSESLRSGARAGGGGGA